MKSVVKNNALAVKRITVQYLYLYFALVPMQTEILW